MKGNDDCKTLVKYKFHDKHILIVKIYQNMKYVEQKFDDET